MAAVRQWIGGFLKKHRARFAPHDWPSADGSEAGNEESKTFLQTWIGAFEDNNVTEGEADVASRLLGPTPPNWRREHLQMVMTKIWEQRKLQSSSGTVQDAAREASSTCAYCGGSGLVVAWAVLPSRENRIPESVPAHCICKHGRWHRQACGDAGSRGVLDFADVLDGRTPGWLEHPPGRPELAVGYQPPAVLRETEPATVPFNRHSLGDMFRPSRAQ